MENKTQKTKGNLVRGKSKNNITEFLLRCLDKCLHSKNWHWLFIYKVIFTAIYMRDTNDTLFCIMNVPSHIVISFFWVVCCCWLIELFFSSLLHAICRNAIWLDFISCSYSSRSSNHRVCVTQSGVKPLISFLCVSECLNS